MLEKISKISCVMAMLLVAGLYCPFLHSKPQACVSVSPSPSPTVMPSPTMKSARK